MTVGQVQFPTSWTINDGSITGHSPTPAPTLAPGESAPSQAAQALAALDAAGLCAPTDMSQDCAKLTMGIVGGLLGTCFCCCCTVIICCCCQSRGGRSNNRDRSRKKDKKNKTKVQPLKSGEASA